MEDFWIGDQVIIKTTRQLGKFEGVFPSGKFKILVNGLYLEIDQQDVELFKHEEDDDDEFLAEMDQSITQQTVAFSTELDLHIEVLEPTLANENPHVIVAYQRKRCKEFMKAAINNRASHVKIIHGKGTGALKAEILHLLRHLPEVFIIQEIHQGGAQEVILNYKDK